MDVDRRTVLELAAGLFIILAFTAGGYIVSLTYAVDGNETANSSVAPAVQPTGGIALIGTIAGFILVVAAIGLFMYSQDFDEEE